MPESVLVSYEDLEAIYQTVATLHSFCLSQDLSNQYKNLATQVKRSPLTAQAERAEDRLAIYVAEAVADDVSEE